MPAYPREVREQARRNALKTWGSRPLVSRFLANRFRHKSPEAHAMLARMFERRMPGLLEAVGIPLTLDLGGSVDWSGWEDAVWTDVLSKVKPGRGAAAKVRAMGLDYDEFKRRAAAQE